MAFDPIVKGWPGPDPRLVVRIAAGNLMVSGVYTSVAAQDINVQPNASNYIYYDFAANALATNTTGFPANCFPIVIAGTDATTVLSLNDQRPDFLVSIG